MRGPVPSAPRPSPAPPPAPHACRSRQPRSAQPRRGARARRAAVPSAMAGLLWLAHAPPLGSIQRTRASLKKWEGGRGGRTGSGWGDSCSSGRAGEEGELCPFGGRRGVWARAILGALVHGLDPPAPNTVPLHGRGRCSGGRRAVHVCCQMTQKGEGREKGRQWSVLLVRGAGGKDESLPSVPTGGRSGRVLTLSGCGGISTSRAAFGILGRNEEGGAPGGYDGGDARGGGGGGGSTGGDAAFTRRRLVAPPLPCGGCLCGSACALTESSIPFDDHQGFKPLGNVRDRQLQIVR